jgi:hypothetical protein
MRAYSKPRRSWPWILAATLAIGAIIAIGAKVHAAAKPQISSDDAIAMIRLQQKINIIGKKFQDDSDTLKKKAEAEAAPYFKESNGIQARVCKANHFGPTCYIDLLAQTVAEKEPAVPKAVSK